MTVKELIEKLKVMPEDAEVLQLGDDVNAKVVNVSGVIWSGVSFSKESKYPRGLVGLTGEKI